MTVIPPQARLLRQRDYKTLIVLDACRFDYFAELCRFRRWRGVLQRVRSPYNNTADWINYSLPNASLEDLTMISGSPVAWARCRRVVEALQEAIGLSRIGNIDNFPKPELCLEEAYRVLEADPERRLFIHLIPPHLPFMGAKGDAFLRKLYRLDKNEPIGIRPNIYHDVRRYALRQRDWSEIIGYYKENIEVGMNAILEADFLKRPIVVTSDHGELIGEHNTYRHFAMTVPWLVMQ